MMEDSERGIDEIREDLKSHRRIAAEALAGMRELIDAAVSETVKMKAIKSRLEWLRESAGGSAETTALPGEGEGEPTTKQLDWELEKLQVVQRLLGASPPRSYGEESSLGPAAPAPQIRKKKVLVVDDDPITVNIVTHYLQRENYETQSSLSGVDGLRLALGENPDLIVLDILMPDLTGFQFLSAFRQAKKDRATPVIILSSLSAEADVLSGLEFGAADYVTKPFSPLVLMAKIKKTLGD